MGNFYLHENLHILFLVLVLILFLLNAIRHNADYYLKKGIKLLEENNLLEAEKAFKAALKRSKDCVNICGHLTEIYFKLKKYDKAEELYRNLLKKQPDEPVYLHNLALTLQMEGKNEEAIELYKRLIDIDEKDYDSNFNLGVIYFNNNNYKEAKEYFVKSNIISQDKIASKYYLIRCEDELCEYNDKNKEQKIIDSYLNLGGKTGLPEEYNASIAKAYAKSGDLENAEKFAKKAIIINADNAEPYIILGLVQTIKGEKKYALNNVSIATELDSNSKDGYNLIRHLKD